MILNLILSYFKNFSLFFNRKEEDSPFQESLKEAFSIENFDKAYKEVNKRKELFLEEVYKPLFLLSRQEIERENFESFEEFVEKVSSDMDTKISKLDFDKLSKKYDLSVEALKSFVALENIQSISRLKFL